MPAGDKPDICKGCGKPVLEGEARYGAAPPGEEWHWDCHPRAQREDPLKELRRIDDDMRRTLDNLRREIRKLDR